MFWRCSPKEGVVWARNLKEWECSLAEADPSTRFHQFSGSGRRAIDDVVRTALLEVTMDLKEEVRCNHLIFASLNLFSISTN